MTEITSKEEVEKLYDANNISLGPIPFLESGYIINIDNTPLEKHPVLGERRHWHVYRIRNHAVTGIISLSDEKLKSLVRYMENIND